MASVMNGARGGEVIERLLEVRSITALPEYQRVLERHYEQIDGIDQQPFIEPEKRKRKALVHEQTTADLERALDKALAERSREFEQQEGQARAAARGDQWVSGPAFQTAEEARHEGRQFRREQALATEWQLVLSNLSNLTEAAALEQLAEDARLTENPRIYRSAMSAIVQQAGRLAAVERRKNPTGPLGRMAIAHGTLSSSLAEWQRANPTPAERLRQIADAKARHQAEVQRSALVYQQAFGLAPVS